MRSVLRATVLALGVAAVAAPIPAYADGEYLRVTPSTIQAGFQVEIDAFCGDTVNAAKVESDAFGIVTILPQPDSGTGKVIHRGTVTIPSRKMARAYPVKLSCPGNQTATTTLNVVGFNLGSGGPHTGGGGLANSNSGNMMIGVGSVVAGAGVLLFIVARRRRAPV